MANQKLICWSGLLLMLGGIGLAVHYITHPPGETAQYVAYPLWGFSHWLGGIAMLLCLLGLVGLFARQSEKVGALGLAGFILAFVGFALGASANMLGGAVYQPFIATYAPDWLELNSALNTFSAFRLLAGMILVLLLGLLLFGIATLRARVLPRWGAWLVMCALPIGVLALALIGTSLQGILQTLAGVASGLGMVAWGYALWSEKSEVVGQFKPAR